jgi:fumarate hydratase class I
LAKKSLMEPIDIGELLARGAKSKIEELRLEIYRRVNALGIGAQGLGGLTTVLDVKVLDYPTHAASLPVAVIPNCAATRHIHFSLDGAGPAVLEPPNLDLWPKVHWTPAAGARRVSLDGLTRAEIASWKPGEQLLLSGKLLTGRDAAHKRICALLDAGEPLPDGLDFHGRVIYYVGPVDPVGTEIVGPAGPTTANRMDRFTDTMLGKSGLLAMVGKAERGPETVASIAKHGSAYLIAVGGAAFLVSNAIRASRVVAFPELGMEAVYEFEVRDMPVTVAVTSDGESVHETGPKAWRGRFAGIPVTVE